jgi:hypothetical protein
MGEDASELYRLRHLLDDPLSVVALRKAVAEDPVTAAGARAEDRKLLADIAPATARLGHPLLRPRKLTPLAPVRVRPEEPAQPPEAALPAAEQELAWIRFRVVDDETNQGIAGVTLRIRLPKGETRPFTTDGSGEIEINDLGPGTCDIEKMIDADALEVVQVV